MCLLVSICVLQRPPGAHARPLAAAAAAASVPSSPGSASKEFHQNFTRIYGISPELNGISSELHQSIESEHLTKGHSHNIAFPQREAAPASHARHQVVGVRLVGSAQVRAYDDGA